MCREAMVEVLRRAAGDDAFMAGLAERGSCMLGGYDLTPEEKAALVSGDIGWVKRQVGELDGLDRWLVARLAQEKW